MALTNYTTTDEVRSLLGVSPKEVKDAVITTNTNLLVVLEKLDEIDAGVREAYQLALDTDPPSSLQARFILLVQTFCAYTVALTMIPALPALAPKRITDGKSETERVDNPFTALEPGMRSNLEFVCKKLKTAYSNLTGNATTVAPPRIMASSSPLATDPITG